MSWEIKRLYRYREGRFDRCKSDRFRRPLNWDKKEFFLKSATTSRGGPDSFQGLSSYAQLSWWWLICQNKQFDCYRSEWGYVHGIMWFYNLKSGNFMPNIKSNKFPAHGDLLSIFTRSLSLKGVGIFLIIIKLLVKTKTKIDISCVIGRKNHNCMFCVQNRK